MIHQLPLVLYITGASKAPLLLVGRLGNPHLFAASLHHAAVVPPLVSGARHARHATPLTGWLGQPVPCRPVTVINHY